MPFLDNFILYDKILPNGFDGNCVKIEVYDYCNGDFPTSKDGRVDCQAELIPCTFDNPEQDIISLNKETYVRLLNDEKVISENLREYPDSPKYLHQKKYIRDVKSYFRYWYSRNDINAPENSFIYSEDYRTINLNGVKYYPTSKQAEIIAILHENYLQNTPDISVSTIISLLDDSSSTKYKKLKEFFNSDSESNRIYKEVIAKGHRKDTFKLNLK